MARHERCERGDKLGRTLSKPVVCAAMYSRSMQVLRDENVCNAVEERDIGARFYCKVDVGHHRGFGHARIHDNERARLRAGRGAVDTLAEDRVVIRNVGTDEKDHVGVLHVRVGAGWTVGAEGELVAGDSGCHAQRRVAIVVGRAKTELHELAQSVGLFGKELTGTYNTQRFLAIALLNVADARDHCVECFLP